MGASALNHVGYASVRFLLIFVAVALCSGQRLAAGARIDGDLPSSAAKEWMRTRVANDPQTRQIEVLYRSLRFEPKGDAPVEALATVRFWPQEVQIPFLMLVVKERAAAGLMTPLDSSIGDQVVSVAKLPLKFKMIGICGNAAASARESMSMQDDVKAAARENKPVRDALLKWWTKEGRKQFP